MRHKMTEIRHVILVSGKRKCGKDYVADMLQKSLSKERCQIARISEPIKSEWSRKLNLNLEELLSDSSYKERYRKDMIVWSDDVRLEDYGYFCRTAMKNVNAEIVIVSDIRRKTDIRFFRDTYGVRVKTVRLISSETVRKDRGWSFTTGVDDCASECDLDDVSLDSWDLVVENNGDRTGEQLAEFILNKLKLN